MLLQFNVAKMRAPFSDPLFDDFKSQLDSVHQVADQDPNFLWRLKGELNAEGYIAPYPKFPLLMGNLSAWRDFESMYSYTFTGPHLEVMKNKRKWFGKLDGFYSVIFYLHDNWLEQPDYCLLETAKLRLTHYQDNGPSQLGFGYQDQNEYSRS